MGTYLSKPITEKSSSDETNDKLIYGVSSMQGWRESQEDAHNSILDYDENTAFFAVYDGHGGQEVAQYCSEKLPHFIKSTEAYKKGDIEQGLIDGFLGFDATITTPEGTEDLKKIVGIKDDDEESADDEEENIENLRQEASMPIEKVIEKYTNLVNPTLRSFKKVMEAAKSASNIESSVASASSSSDEIDVTTEQREQTCTSKNSKVEAEEENACSSSTTKSEQPDSSSSKETIITNKPEEVFVNNSTETVVENATTSSEPKQADSAGIQKNEKKSVIQQNGAISTENKDDVSSSVNEDVGGSNKEKGKSPMKKRCTTTRVTRPKRNAVQLYQSLICKGQEGETEEEESEDEEDKTFTKLQGLLQENSSDEESEEMDSEEESSEDDENNDEDENRLDEEKRSEEYENDEDKIKRDEENETAFDFVRNMPEGPGWDSGCTAVVAVLKGTELFVANAGDSRCVLCRNGKAVEMSFDHKPEDVPERERIKKAGGIVSEDGRVNGGLNLSRAIGDFGYKINKELSDREQMITALPDIKKLTINPTEDEFMVLACDGIWNSMSSQEVVDFIKTRLDKNTDKISHICEELFDFCLAPDTLTDGSGCDNMTAIIVKFNNSIKKRSLSPNNSECEQVEAKRAKTEYVHPTENKETL